MNEMEKQFAWEMQNRKQFKISYFPLACSRHPTCEGVAVPASPLLRSGRSSVSFGLRLEPGGRPRPRPRPRPPPAAPAPGNLPPLRTVSIILRVSAFIFSANWPYCDWGPLKRMQLSNMRSKSACTGGDEGSGVLIVSMCAQKSKNHGIFRQTLLNQSPSTKYPL